MGDHIFSGKILWNGMEFCVAPICLHLVWTYLEVTDPRSIPFSGQSHINVLSERQKRYTSRVKPLSDTKICLYTFIFDGRYSLHRPKFSGERWVYKARDDSSFGLEWTVDHYHSNFFFTALGDQGNSNCGNDISVIKSNIFLSPKLN